MNPPLPLTGPDTPDSPGAEGHPLHEHHLLRAGRLWGHPRAHQGQDQPTTQPAQPPSPSRGRRLSGLGKGRTRP